LVELDLGVWQGPLTLIAALLLSLYFTPTIRRGALKYGVVDQPDGKLKVHETPVAYLGGVAVYLAFLFALAFAYDFTPQVLGILLAASIVVMLGLFDDLKVLPPTVKLLGQGVACMVLIKADVMIRLSILPSWAAVVLTVVWLLGTTNAINLVDVSDGLAGGVSAIAGVCLFVVSAWNGNQDLGMMAAALVGATLGFLVFNRPPARIYLGDTGSMFLGFMLGALAMTNHYTFRHPWAALAPVLILGVPIFDTLFVMGVRARRRIPIMQGSPDHFAVRLRRHGLGRWTIAGIGWGASTLLGAAGLTTCQVEPAVAAGILGGVLGLTAAAVLVLVRMGRGPDHPASPTSGDGSGPLSADGWRG
jgi:UDP-GlcNAc:undecaprenyl-phosphate/decaprenyl-phosphate GlcNAc-1-phosphate transferase